MSKYMEFLDELNGLCQKNGLHIDIVQRANWVSNLVVIDGKQRHTIDWDGESRKYVMPYEDEEKTT